MVLADVSAVWRRSRAAAGVAARAGAPGRRAATGAGRRLLAVVLPVLLTAAATGAERVPGCDDLNWSAQVLQANPDIRETCLGVYVRKGKYYALSTIQLERVSAGRVTFRPLRRDGTLGKPRRIAVPDSWQVTVEGRSYRPDDLSPGQRLNVYIPEDRFALSFHGSEVDGDDALLPIDESPPPASQQP